MLHLLLLFILSCEAHKILVYNSKFGHSHSNFLGTIADILAEEGNEVVSLISELDMRVSDCTNRSRIVRVPQHQDAWNKWNNVLNEGLDPFEGEEGIYWAWTVGSLLGEAFSLQCGSIFEQEGLIDSLRGEQFDVIIAETFDYCGVGLHKVIGTKALITVSSTMLFQGAGSDLGVPTMRNFNPSFGTSRFNPHSLFDRMKNIYYGFANDLMFYHSKRNCYYEYKKRFGPSFPSMPEIIASSALHMTNAEPHLDFAVPMLRKVVDLGGLAVKKPQPLVEKWNNILSARKSTILVSFGSLARSTQLGGLKKSAILKAFEHFPNVTFVWKYEDSEDEFATKEGSLVENLVMEPWMPQNDLLADKRVIGFVSHAGAGSCYEAALRGVPGIYIPLFADQPRNAGMMENAGIGIVLDKHNLEDTNKIIQALEFLINDHGLRSNALRTASFISERPFTARELLVKHVKFIAKFGPVSTMTPKSVHMSFIEYYMIDALFALVFTIGTIVFGSGIAKRKLQL